MLNQTQHTQHPSPVTGDQQPVEAVLTEQHKLEKLEDLIDHKTEELTPDYRIEGTQRRLHGSFEGNASGVTLVVEQLDRDLNLVWRMTLRREKTHQEAVEEARRKVLAAVLELRPGVKLHRRRFTAPNPLPPTAELGCYQVTVRRFLEELDALGAHYGIGGNSLAIQVQIGEIE